MTQLTHAEYCRNREKWLNADRKTVAFEYYGERI